MQQGADRLLVRPLDAPPVIPRVVAIPPRGKVLALLHLSRLHRLAATQDATVVYVYLAHP